MSVMPVQKPGRSEQVVQTPTNFLNAVRVKLGIREFDCDLAASPENAVCPRYYTERDNSLVQPWLLGTGWNWLNPPYSDIKPWVEKANIESQLGVRVAMLVPSSTGSNWWRDYVFRSAYTIFLNGRITFVGHKSPYPKDLALLLYAPFLNDGYEVWDWE